jgi:beta-lactamase regulating signal transducer with metallopeptidase domain/biopolymer transport protein ExbD
MNPFFEYLIKSTISLSLLYLLFKAFMQNDKTLALNRFLLLGILFVSAIIPLLNFQFFQTEVPVKQVELIREFVAAPLFVAPEIQVADPSVSQPMKSEINYWMLIYGAAIFILVIRLFVSVGKVLQLIRKAEKQKLRNIVLAVVKEMIQPFTFLNHVVLSEKDLNENKKIIVAHEQAHIKQLHAIDLAVCEVFTLLHFFNPLMWLLRRDLKLNHEYLADQAVLNKGIDAQKYQLLVLQKAVGERRFALANNFYQKPILKRIKMMKKNKKRWTQIKLILFVPILLLLLQAFARPELISSPEEFVPLKYQKNATETWLDNWNVENFKNLVTSERRESYKKDPKTGKVVEVLAFSDVVSFNISEKNNITIGKNKGIQEDNIKKVALDFLQGKHPTYQSDPNYFTKDLPEVGEVSISKAEFVVKHVPNSSLETINSTLRKIGEAYLEMRQSKSKEYFGLDYFSLDVEKQKIIDQIIPIRVSLLPPELSQKKPPPPPPPFISVTLGKDRNIIFQNRNYNYEKFENFLKENYRRYKRKLDLSAEVKWDTAVGYQGIHKLAKILDKSGFKDTDFKPFGADGEFLPPPSQQNQSHNKNEVIIVE